ncbi:methyl-accepting chemotaxis protein [Aliiglaciecola sp. LCG003]|uniref:methyl-accepting chemotaxis protein n=1 Tax=Aliiglaciecola sp. LCG003 TaxID=3053655 RepID=UPI002572D535|nr:methyl-accepting chemotaxis protein [Aliiglaciecola sp. LCG003]WJG08134.1 methyl-accepting chemotaxis protein [Aliiglaciecola sp. LCG003]
MYSVFKKVDFATNLKTGPYANSEIGLAYQMAAKSSSEDEVFFTHFRNYRPSYDALSGFASSPIYVDGNKAAVLIYKMPMKHLNSLLTHSGKWKDYGFGDTGESYLVSSAGVLITESRYFLEDMDSYIKEISEVHPNQAKEMRARNTSIGVQPVDTASAKAALSGQSGFMKVEDYNGIEVFSAYSPLKVGNIQMAILAEIKVDEAVQASKSLRNELIWTMILEMIILVFIAGVISWFISNRMVKPLNELGDAFEEVTSGNGDLTSRLKSSNIPEINRVTQSFNTFIGQIREIIAQIKLDADTLASASQQLSAVTSQSYNITSIQGEQTEIVSSSMVELAASIEEVSRSTVDTSTKSLQAQESLKENMERADMAAQNIKLLVQLINDSSEVISSLKNEVQQITAALTVITSIADQTNLLALNAAIEAARAGEAGRGFSVVADEVRALATRSQQSTVEISKLVEVMNISSQKSVERMERAGAAASGGIHLVDLVTVAMDELSVSLKALLALTDTVVATTVEQNATSASVAESVQKINDMASEVMDGSNQTRQAAEELAKIAEKTRELVSRFKV